MLRSTPLKADPNQALVDVEYQEVGTYVNGEWITTRRLNGDEGSGSRGIRNGLAQANDVGTMRFQKNATGAYRIVRIKFYHY